MARNTTAQQFDLSTPEGRIAAREARTGKKVGTKAQAAPKAKAKTVAEPVELQQIHAAHSEETTEDLVSRAQGAFDDLLTKLGAASPARYLCSAILALAVAAGLGWMISQLLLGLMIAVVVGTGSTFLAYLVLFIGCIVSAILGYKVTGKVFDYVVTKRIDAHWNATKNAIGSFFTAKPVAPITEA